MTRKRIIGALCFIFALICLCVMHGYAEEPELTPEGSGRFCYDRLDESLRKTYNEIAAGVAAFVESEAYEEEDFTEQTGYFTVDVTNATYGDVTRAFAAFYFDNPQYFWMYFNTFLQDTDGNDISSLPCDEVPIWIYSEYYKRLDRSVAEILIESEAKDWVKELRGEATDYDRVVRLHDMICDAVDYAEDADGGKGYKLWAYNIDGVLNKKGAVCQGYAATFSYILNLLGIDNAFIPGVTDSGENHTWNAVYLDDAYYLIDVTWDDTTGTYLYFFMPADTFETEHIQGRMNGVTQDFFVTTEAYGNDSEYQFYTYTGAYVPSNVSDEDLEAYLEGALDHRYHDKFLFISDDTETLKRIHKELTSGLESLWTPTIYETLYGYGFYYEVKETVELNPPVLSGYLHKDEEHPVMNDTLRFQWTEEKNATSYRMYRSKTILGEKEYVGRYDGTVSGMWYKYDAEYYYYVTAYYLPAGQESDYSAPLKIDIGEDPLYSDIYYSDLFYVYDSQYLTNGYLNTYGHEVQGMMLQVMDDYMNSLWWITADIKTGIHAAVHWDDWCRIVSDKVFGTSFQYNQALDAANLKFAQNMMDEAWWQNASSELSGTFSKADKIGKLLSTIESEMDIDSMTTDNLFACYLSKVMESQVFVHISVGNLESMKTIKVSQLLGDGVKYGKEALNIVKTLAVGMLLEDLRMEMIDRLNQEAPTSSALYQGMVRLKNQMKNGFVGYFIQNYVTKKAVSKLSGAVVDAIFSKDFLKVKACITLIVDVMTDVVFASAPNVEDFLMLSVLHEYSLNLNSILDNYPATFQKQFTTEDIEMYSMIINTYIAVNNAGLKQAQKFDRNCNRRQLERVISKYADLTYDSYIRMVKRDIAAQSKPEAKTFDSWTFKDGSVFQTGSDALEKGVIYTAGSYFRCKKLTFTGTGSITLLPYNLLIYGAATVSGNWTIAEGAQVYLCGDLTVTGTLTLAEGAYLEVGGDRIASSPEDPYAFRTLRVNGTVVVSEGATLTVEGDIDVDTDAHIYNHGTLNAVNVTLKYSNERYYGKYYQTEADAVLNLTGNFYADRIDCCDITAGTVVFKGEEQQTVRNLKAYNVEVLNSQGIKYLTDLRLYGTYDLHGNPLNNNGFCTIPYGEASFANGSNYQNINISVAYVLKKDLLCQNVYVYDTLTIAKGATLTVEGDVIANDVYMGSSIYNHGTLNAVNVTLKYYSGSYYGKYYQTETDTVLNLTGKFEAGNLTCCDITAGTVIFNGTEQQTVQNLKAYNVEVLNPKGLKYLSNITVTGNYDRHQNPIETGSYRTVFSGEGGFGTLPENQSDWITTILPTTESAGERHKECLICGETVCREEIPIMVKPDPENCEHSFGAWTVVTAPTCTETGSDSRVCPLCDLEETRTTDALGHDHDSVVTAPTCTEQGHTTHTCSRCGDSYTDSVTAAMGHTPGAEADCLNDQVCTVCGTVLVGKLGHDYHSVVTAPTCTEQGHTTHTCSRCGDSYTDSETAAMGHTPGEWIVDQEPAPGVEGSKHVECTVCHHVLETAAIEAHPVETAPESEPESEHESEPESEPESETEPETDEEPETEKAEESEAETTIAPETDHATEPETAEDTETQTESKQSQLLPSFGCSGVLYTDLLGMILVAAMSSLVLKKRKED